MRLPMRGIPGPENAGQDIAGALALIDPDGIIF
jgi:hypothetical protein